MGKILGLKEALKLSRRSQVFSVKAQVEVSQFSWVDLAVERPLSLSTIKWVDLNTLGSLSLKLAVSKTGQ